ncbi:hypothetical protein PoB_000841800 [Plakobranchus ocellatus]|uniref:Uncharacterized protein n=1 Tax=Plakobranchus ocellatus TaxID=259542 RepID=A0AAV3YHN0_9GAST|nr:hypothetical protein PoB_000841800 [Plakobranchus ocellatus]
MVSPLLILFTCALVVGLVATLIVVVAVSVDQWECSTFSHDAIVSINNSCTFGTKIECRIYQLSNDPILYRYDEYRENEPTNRSQYFYTTNSGLWRTCDSLTHELRQKMQWAESNFNGRQCFTFVTDYDEESENLSHGSKQIARLQNSAASCYIVVVIDLTSAAIVGIIGLANKQVASCMVTGVLYLMAALFCVFGLSMFHTKDYYEKYQCYALDEIPSRVCPAREVTLGYAVPLAWVGVIACGLACIIWLCVSRALRVIMAKTML